MPGLTEQPETAFEKISVRKLHPTFGAQISGVDFSSPLSDEVFAEVLAAITKFGVVVFRGTTLDDKAHIEFARRFGELDDIKPYVAAGRKNRLQYDELFDVSNVEDDGSLVDPNGPRAQASKGNSIFHVDSSFNPRRAGYSLLLAHELPPPGNGGNTQFADTRTAFEDLDDKMKKDLVEKDYIVHHSLIHSRKVAAPEFFAHMNPEDHPMNRHRLTQIHEPSDRTNLYIAAHAHHIEGMDPKESRALLDKLYNHAQQAQYVLDVQWEGVGDLVLWDNTCTMHRVAGGSYEGKYRRDMRRATVHDGSSQGWGLNEHTDERQGLP